MLPFKLTFKHICTYFYAYTINRFNFFNVFLLYKSLKEKSKKKTPFKLRYRLVHPFLKSCWRQNLPLSIPCCYQGPVFYTGLNMLCNYYTLKGL